MQKSRLSNWPLFFFLAAAMAGLTGCESDKYGYAETRGLTFEKPTEKKVNVKPPAKPDAQSWFNLGFEYQTKHEWPEAIYCFDKACELEPKNKGFWNGLGNANQFADRMEAARVAFLRAHALDSYESGIMTSIAFVDTRQGRHDAESAKYYLMALSLNPSLKDAWDNLIGIFHRLDEDELVPIIQKMANGPPDNSAHVADMVNDRYISRYPDDHDGYVTKGVLNTRFLNVAVAKASFDKALQLRKDDPRALISYGVLYDALGDQKKALEYFTRCTQVSPTQAMAWISKGAIEYRMKNYAAAEDSYSKGSALTPEVAAWSAKIGEMHALVEQQNKAVAAPAAKSAAK